MGYLCVNFWWLFFCHPEFQRFQVGLAEASLSLSAFSREITRRSIELRDASDERRDVGELHFSSSYSRGSCCPVSRYS